MNLSKNFKSNITHYLTLILLIFMPLHFYVFELFTKDFKLDNIWRDLIIILILAILFFKKQIKIDMISWIIIVNILAIGAVAIHSKLTNNYPGTLNILRTYTMPCLAYFISKNIKLDDKKYSNIFKTLGIVFAIIAIYGMFQAFVLGPDFLVKIGYRSENGVLISHSFFISHFYGEQRVTGTFVSPNNMGIVFAMVMLMLIFSKHMREWKNRSIALFFMLIALMGTFSRSSLVGFVGALICGIIYNYIFYYRNSTGLNKFSKWLKGVKLSILQAINSDGKSRYIFIIIAVAVLSVLDIVLRKGLFFRMQFSSYLGIVTGSDPSSQKHLNDIIDGENKLPSSPDDFIAYGFGSNGPMALPIVDGAHNVESSFLLMINEIGVVLAILYFLPYIMIIFKTLLNKSYNFAGPACVAIATLFTYLLLPNVQSFEILFFSYFFMGLYSNEYIKKKYSVKNEMQGVLA